MTRLPSFNDIDSLKSLLIVFRELIKLRPSFFHLNHVSLVFKMDGKQGNSRLDPLGTFFFNSPRELRKGVSVNKNQKN